MKYLAIDLGMGAEPTALVVIEAKAWEYVETRQVRSEYASESVPFFRKPDGSVTREFPPAPVYHLRHLERMPPGTSYPDVVSRVENLAPLLREPNLKPLLAIDVTGTGRAATDLFEKAGLSPWLVTATAAGDVVQEGMRYRVPKRDLITTAQVILQTGRLKIARDLPHGDLLVRELRSFRMTVDLRKHDEALAWREGANDDLVLALSTGLWIAGKHDGIPRGITVVYRQRSNKYMF